VFWPSWPYDIAVFRLAHGSRCFVPLLLRQVQIVAKDDRCPICKLRVQEPAHGVGGVIDQLYQWEMACLAAIRNAVQIKVSRRNPIARDMMMADVGESGRNCLKERGCDWLRQRAGGGREGAERCREDGKESSDDGTGC